MKKTILGTGLIICGVLGILASEIIEAIYFASPNHIIQSGINPLLIWGCIFLLIGIALNVKGFLDDRDK